MVFVNLVQVNKMEQEHCDVLCIPGCTDPEAINYDPTAEDDNGTCTYPVPGCMDSSTCNYNPDATIDDGSCIYDAYPYVIDDCFPCLDNDGDEVCDIYEIFGCQDEGACNYNPDATTDDGSCLATGCTYPGADNYDAANTGQPTR